MATFSRTSQERLATCHPDIQKVMTEVIKHRDITVLDGARTLEQQRAYVASGHSHTLNSKHLVQSDGYSHAIDIAPYPIDFNDRERFYYTAGFILGVAEVLGVKLRWGGDWDGDSDIHDQKFYDLPHFELKE